MPDARSASSSTGNKVDYTIDELTPSDWKSVRAIYSEGIATGQATFEVESPTWQQWDTNHLPVCRFVARTENRVIAWAALSPVSQRKCYEGVAEVSVYVSTAYRRQGVGKALMQALIGESERCGIWTLQGSTFPENTASLRLQAIFGFRLVGHRERIACHHGIWRDTVIMERRSHVVGTDSER